MILKKNTHHHYNDTYGQDHSNCQQHLLQSGVSNVGRNNASNSCDKGKHEPSQIKWNTTITDDTIYSHDDRHQEVVPRRN